MYETESIIKDAEVLLYGIKDVRDELKILHAVATYQQDIQQSLSTNSGTVKSSRTATYVVNDINAMDKVARDIESSVGLLHKVHFQPIHVTNNVGYRSIRLEVFSKDKKPLGRDGLLWSSQ